MRKAAGGPAEGLRLIVGGYVRDGHEAEIATLDPEGTDFADVGVPVHTLGKATFGYGRSQPLARWLHTNAARFQGVVVHGLWQYQGLAALQELRGKHRYLVFPHGMLDPWFNRTYPLKRLKKLPYWILVERHVLAGAQAVLFTSTTEARLAAESFPAAKWRSEVVPYGTLGPPGDAAKELAAFEERVPQIAGQPFLLYASRLHPKKGCDLLLQAYAAVCKGADLPQLIMAGPDEAGLTTSLQILAETLGISDKILWPGMLEDAAKWGAFRAASAFVLPSHQENFGIAVAEALSCATPVLISDQVNIHAEVTAAAAGLVEPDTLEGTIRLFRQWVSLSETERQRMGRNGLHCWQMHFRSDGTSRAIAGLLVERRTLSASSHVPERRRARA